MTGVLFVSDYAAMCELKLLFLFISGKQYIFSQIKYGAFFRESTDDFSE